MEYEYEMKRKTKNTVKGIKLALFSSLLFLGCLLVWVIFLDSYQLSKVVIPSAVEESLSKSKKGSLDSLRSLGMTMEEGFVRKLIPTAQAAITKQINYQGKLTNSSSWAVPDGNYDMRFKVYDALTDGNLLWTGTHTAANGNAVPVANGIFSVQLGSGAGNTLSLDFSASSGYWLQVEIYNSDTPAWETFSPRKSMVSVPQAINANNVIGDGRIDIAYTDNSNTALKVIQSGTGDIVNILDGANEVFTILDGGNVGIGTTSPGAPLDFAASVGQKINLYDGYNYGMGMQSSLMEFIVHNNGADFTFGYGTSGSLTRLMTIKGGGSVGINTTGPDRKLDVLDASNPQLRLSQADGTVYADFQMTSNGDMVMNVDGVSNQLVLDNAGYVGIGTATPGATLDVVGDVQQSTYSKRQVFSGTVANTDTNHSIEFTFPAGKARGGHTRIVFDIWSSYSGIAGRQSAVVELVYSQNSVNTVSISPLEYKVYGSSLSLDAGYSTGTNKFSVDFTTSVPASGSKYITATVETVSHVSTHPTVALTGTAAGTLTAIPNKFSTSNSNYITSGSMGIGATTPDRKLEVLDASNPQLRLTQADGTVYADFQMTSNGDMVMNVDGVSNQLVLDNSGYIGIGDASPVANLVVGSDAGAGYANGAGDVYIQNDLEVDGNVYIGTSGFTAQTQHKVTDASVAGAGWYRVAHIDGGAGRGQQQVTIYTIGGSYTTYSTTIRWWHSWSTPAGLSVISESGSAYWTDARITDDGTNSYLEVYFTQAMSFYLGLQYIGGHDLGDIYSGALSAGGDTERATAKLNSLFGLGDKLTVTSGGSMGLGTTGPDRKLDVLDASNPQLRLTYTDGTVYTDFQTTSSGYLYLNPSGGRIGVGTNSPDQRLEVLDASSPQLRLTQADGTVYADFQMNSSGDMAMNVDGVSNQLVLDNGGNVGIGLNNPGAKIDVSTALTTAYSTDWGANSPTGNIARLINTDNSVADYYSGLLFQVGASSGFATGMISLIDPGSTGDYGGDFTFQVRNSGSPYTLREIMRIKGSGNIGINTTGPDRRLDVLDDTNPQLRLSQADGTVYAEMQADSSGYLYVNATGDRVGIEDNTPSYTLDVNGDIGVADAEEYFIGSTQVLSKGVGSLTGNLVVGDGGGSLSHTTGNEGYYNTFSGIGAGFANTTGYGNFFGGYRAGYNNTTGLYNNAIGAWALNNNISGSNNIVMGYGSGLYNETGSSNILIGTSAGRGVETNSYSNNTFIGHQTGYSTTTGGSNFFGGYQAGYTNATGAEDVFLGYQAGFYNTANYNTFIGSASGLNNTGGSYNTSLGRYSGFYNQSGNYNTLIGNDAGKGVASNSYSNNTFIGYQTGYSTTTGGSNFFGGYQAGYLNQTGTQNVFIGLSAGYSNTAHNNTFVGYSAGKNTTSGTTNVAMGGYSFNYNQAGSANVSIGYGAGQGVAGNSYSNNTFIGHQTGYSTTTGGNNVALGYQSGYSNAAGEYNVFLGYQAGYSETGSNKLYIDNSNTATPLIYGDFSTDALTVNGTLGTTGNITVTKADPAIVLNTTTATDTDFWVGVTEDALGTDDDYFQIGDGTTPGANPFVTIDTSGYMGLGDASPVANLVVGADTTAGYANGAGDVYIQNDLEVDGTIYGTVSGTINPGFTTGSVIFQGASGLAQDNTNFFWDDSTDRLGILDNTPSYTLDVGGDVNILDSAELRIGTTQVLSKGAGSLTGNLIVGDGGGSLTHTTGSEGYYNTAVGLNALQSITTGFFNTALGYNALSTVTTTSRSTAVGYGALSVSTGAYNTALGDETLLNNTTGYYNTAVGTLAARYNTEGYQNVALGPYALYQNVTGDNNVAIGYESGLGVAANSYSNNTFIGYQTGYSTTTGGNNFFGGYQAGYYNQTGVENVAIGTRAGGYGAGAGNSISYSTFIGSYAGYSNTTGISQNFIGYQAGYSNTTGTDSVALGRNSGYYNQTGSFNTLLGDYAGQGVAANSYSNNTFIGYQTGYSTTTGGNNFFGGYQAGYRNTTAATNVLIGYQAGYNNQTGTRITAIGYQSGGLGSGAANSFNYGAFVGYRAGYSNATADANTFIGDSSGYSTTTGGNNTFLGFTAGYSNISGTGNVFLGRQAGYNETGSDKLYIDNSATATPLLYGDFSTDALTVNGTLGTTGSVTVNDNDGVSNDVNIVLGDANETGQIVMYDGSSNTGTLAVDALSSDAVYTFSGATGTVLTSANFSTNLDSTYVNVTGDTMTGVLTVPSLKLTEGTDIASMGFELNSNPMLPGFQDFMSYANEKATVTGDTGTVAFTNVNYAFDNKTGPSASVTIANAATDTAIVTVDFNTALGGGNSSAYNSFGWSFYTGIYPQDVTVEVDRDGDGTYDITWTETGITEGGVHRTDRQSIGSPWTLKKIRYTFSNWNITGTTYLARLSGWNTSQDMLTGYAGISAPTFYNGITVSTGNIIASSGSIGIGTASPDLNLEVAGSSTSGGIGTGSTMMAKITNTDTTANNRVQLAFGDDAGIMGSLGYQMTDHTNNYGDFAVAARGSDGYLERLRVTSAGNVGINTTGPDRKLDVLDASNPQLRLTQANDTVYADFQMTSGGDMVMNVDGVSNQLVLDNSGFVGIGNNNPGYALDVTGYVNGSSGLCINGDCQTSWSGMALPSGTTGQTLYHNGSAWTATSSLYNNATNVGINTTGPDRRLDVLDDTNPQLRLSQADGTVYADFQMDVNGDMIMKVDGASNQLVLDNGGNVGIGDASPSEKLVVSGVAVVTGGIYGAESTAVDGPIWSVSGTMNSWGMYYNDGAVDRIEFLYGGTPTSAIAIDNGSSYFNTQGGNVGIATDSPDRKLDVLDATNPQLRLTQADNTVYTDFQMTSGGDMVMNVDGVSNQLVLDDSGSVLIGTASPMASPAFNLEVYSGSGPARMRLMGTGDSTNFSGFELVSDEATDKKWQIVHRQEAGYLNSLMYYYYNGSTWSNPMTMNPSGYLGLGDSNPAANLVIGADTGAGYANGAGDAYVQNDLEVDGVAYINSEVLGNLAADWNQNGGYDVVLQNASSELKIKESAGDTYYGTFEVGDLGANATYTFSGATGTVYTNQNDPYDTSGEIQGVAVGGDLSGTVGTAAVTDDSHAHTTTTISGLDISDDTNLTSGNGVSVAGDAVQLGALTTGDWIQSGAYDITLSSASAEIEIKESSGDTYYGTLDVGDLGADATYTFSGVSGTVVTTTNEAVFTGAGRHARLLEFKPEYAGAVLTKFYGGGTETSYTGGMTSDTEGSSPFHNYYNWTSSEASLNGYAVSFSTALPSDFDSWAADNAIQVAYKTTTASDADQEVEVYVYDSTGTLVASSTSGNASASWATVNIDDSSLTGWTTANSTAFIYVRMRAMSDNVVRAGEIKLNYLSKW